MVICAGSDTYPCIPPSFCGSGRSKHSRYSSTAVVIWRPAAPSFELARRHRSYFCKALLASTKHPTDVRLLQTLRHVFLHGVERHQKRLIGKALRQGAKIWADPEDDGEALLSPLRVKGRAIDIERLADRRPSTIERMLATARQHSSFWSQSPPAWTIDKVLAPNATDRDTVINFALMAANAYTLVPNTNDWEDLDPRFGLNTSLDFGWESNGLRGHVYADETNSTIVIGIKGTSRALWDGDETTTNDKENDNLFFACCCAQQGPWTWRQVCDCATSTYGCNSTCLVQNLREDHRYYQAARYLYANVTEIYPNSVVWMAGHSLGGTVSSLLGLTYGLPTMTFESPPDALAAYRLGLPVPRGGSYARPMTGVHHFGHTADPTYMGLCDGSTSTCSLWGYAFQSQCHTGLMCTYDTVMDLGWRVGIWTHGIRTVIQDVLRAYNHTPPCIVDDECVDCYNWNFYESNSSMSTITTSVTSTTRTRTRTSTCKTPGWWGCLDDKTSTTFPITTTTSTSTTSIITSTTCHTPGWFGCKDKTTTTTTTGDSKTTSVAKAPRPWVAPSTIDHGWHSTETTVGPTNAAQNRK